MEGDVSVVIVPLRRRWGVRRRRRLSMEEQTRRCCARVRLGVLLVRRLAKLGFLEYTLGGGGAFSDGVGGRAHVGG